MKPIGFIRPHPLVEIEVSTYDLDFIRKALNLATREGAPGDKTTFRRIEDEVRETLMWASNQSKRVEA